MTMDLIRAPVAIALPFVTQVWQIYLLIFLLQAASAAFTPTFQGTIPDVLPDEGDYTRALSLSRLAYDLENLLSPALAAVLPDRSVMVSAAGLLTALLVILGITLRSTAPDLIWPMLLGLWVLAGIGYSAVQTPTGRLLRRSAHASDRPAVFAAQFALSHGCWLLTYPLAGWLGETAGLSVTTLVLAAVTLAGVAGALLMWPTKDPEVIEHDHPDLSPDDSHLVDASRNRHAHAFVIDDLHTRWPNDA